MLLQAAAQRRELGKISPYWPLFDPIRQEAWFENLFQAAHHRHRVREKSITLKKLAPVAKNTFGSLAALLFFSSLHRKPHLQRALVVQRIAGGGAGCGRRAAPARKRQTAGSRTLPADGHPATLPRASGAGCRAHARLKTEAGRDPSERVPRPRWGTPAQSAAARYRASRRVEAVSMRFSAQITINWRAYSPPGRWYPTRPDPIFHRRGGLRQSAPSRPGSNPARRKGGRRRSPRLQPCRAPPPCLCVPPAAPGSRCGRRARGAAGGWCHTRRAGWGCPWPPPTLLLRAALQIDALFDQRRRGEDGGKQAGFAVDGVSAVEQIALQGLVAVYERLHHHVGAGFGGQQPGRVAHVQAHDARRTRPVFQRGVAGGVPQQRHPQTGGGAFGQAAAAQPERRHPLRRVTSHPELPPAGRAPV